MNHHRSSRRRGALLSLAAMLAGGTSFTSCDTRVRTAAVGGAKNFVYSLFDPTFLFPEIFDQSADSGGSSNGP